MRDINTTKANLEKLIFTNEGPDDQGWKLQNDSMVKLFAYQSGCRALSEDKGEGRVLRYFLNSVGGQCHYPKQEMAMDFVPLLLMVTIPENNFKEYILPYMNRPDLWQERLQPARNMISGDRSI
jgi:hypothetical protein